MSAPPLAEVRSVAATPARGLDDTEAALRLAQDGPNELPRPRRPSQLLLLAGQLTHFFALMLWVAAALAVVAGMPALGMAIALVVVLNGLFAYAQEWRADRANERLAALLPERVTVRRSGRRITIAARELVVGDAVLLSPGDKVCADLALVRVDDLMLDESMLTGESVPVRPAPGGFAFAGTFVVEGEGDAVVVATGASTRLAGISTVTDAARPPPSPLARQLHRVVRAVAGIAVTVGAGCFLLLLAVGTDPTDGFLFAIGITVALVPEGLLPTVTLSLAHAAQRMAGRNALVRRLDAVETLGATTFICSDKTGTITRNEMSVVAVWTPAGEATVRGEGYDPEGAVAAGPAVRAAVQELATTAVRCSSGRVVETAGGGWRAHGDPMEAALHALALRSGAPMDADAPDRGERRFPFDPRRRRESVVHDGVLSVKGAPDTVLPLCGAAPGAEAALDSMTSRGLRVLAVARRPARWSRPPAGAWEAEVDLELLGLVGLEDPPREGVARAIAQCRRAGIRLALVTGDHPNTARAIAAEVGLLGPAGLVLTGSDLPADLDELGALIDADGVVLARVAPEDKLRVACALQRRGHVVAMTGDGVNDGPALRQADIGVAMGRSGTDVARSAADLVLLDDAFETIVAAIELGRATFANIRRFLTYHLTDNVAELTPFAVWAFTAGRVPLALTVLMVLALDIGTDLLPAVALGAEPPPAHVLERPPTGSDLIDRALLLRAFTVLGPAEAVVEMAAFGAVLVAGGWRWGETPSDALLASAAGAAFAAVVLGQLGNAFACRSSARPVWVSGLRGNPLLLGAVGFELVALAVFLGVPPVSDVLGGSLPSALGWAVAALAVPVVLAADTGQKRWFHGR